MIKIELKVKRNQGRDRDRTFNLLPDMDLDFDYLFYCFVPDWQVLWRPSLIDLETKLPMSA